MGVQLKPLNEQVIVLVGASSGIGRATALEAARRGAQVVVAARDEEGLLSLVAEIIQAGGESSYIVADVSDYQQVKAIAEFAENEYHRIDTWVNLAAVSLYARLQDTTPEEFRRVIDVNLLGQVYGAMIALPYLQRSGGALISVTSAEGKRALPLQSAYAASKHGVVGMLDAVRVELEREGAPISVTNIMPISINTPFFNKALSKLGVKPRGIPPVLQPHVVAEAILYAAEHPNREIVVGGPGKLMIVMQNIAPGLLDLFFTRFGFNGQKTSEPKMTIDPHSLYEPVRGEARVEGDFSAEAQPASPYTWLQLNPIARRVISGAALVAVSLLMSKALRRG
jgi:NAD(P)-dependent dehydrogenase (short-subunit alcohol dehydrogenase family)